MIEKDDRTEKGSRRGKVEVTAAVAATVVVVVVSSSSSSSG
jgi:hypothetical protein